MSLTFRIEKATLFLVSITYPKWVCVLNFAAGISDFHHNGSDRINNAVPFFQYIINCQIKSVRCVFNKLNIQFYRNKLIRIAIVPNEEENIICSLSKH